MCSLRIRGVDISNNQLAGPFQKVTFSLRTWQWDVGVCFNESNNQPSVELIACFKDSVDKMYLSRWPGNWNGFRQWEVDQILLWFHCLFWSNNQLKDGWYLFESADACISAVAFNAAFADWGWVKAMFPTHFKELFAMTLWGWTPHFNSVPMA